MYGKELHSSFFLYLFFILLYNYYGDNMKKILMVLMSLIIITGCGDVTINIYKDYKTTDKVEISSKKTKTFKNLTYDEYTKKLANKDSFVLFIWQTGCSHCESFEPKLNNIISYFFALFPIFIFTNSINNLRVIHIPSRGRYNLSTP